MQPLAPMVQVARSPLWVEIKVQVLVGVPR